LHCDLRIDQVDPALRLEGLQYPGQGEQCITLVEVFQLVDDELAIDIDQLGTHARKVLEALDYQHGVHDADHNIQRYIALYPDAGDLLHKAVYRGSPDRVAGRDVNHVLMPLRGDREIQQ